MKAWLDDERPAPDGWVHVKTPLEAIALLQGRNVTEISLDNDLGLHAYAKPNEGRHVADFIEEGAFNGTLEPLRVRIHTQNPQAKVYMKAAIRNAYTYWNAKNDNA